MAGLPEKPKPKPRPRLNQKTSSASDTIQTFTDVNRELEDTLTKMQDELKQFQASFVTKKDDSASMGPVSQNSYVQTQSLTSKCYICSLRGSKPSREIDLLLIGKTGTGKSALGNSILGRHSFESRPDMKSVTREITYDVCEMEGIKIKVVDGPGVGDTRMTKEEGTKDTLNAIAKAITINPKGYHAFLLVVKYGARFTAEDQDTVDVLKKIFGEHFFKRFCIIVMTCGDLFKNDVITNFREWVKDQASGIFEQLLKECDERVVLFDNKANDKIIKENQFKELMQMIEKLLVENCRYSDDHFKSAQFERDVLLVECEKENISEEIMTEANLILHKYLQIIDSIEPYKSGPFLEELSQRALDLLEKIKQKDKETGVLHLLTDHINSISNSILDEIKLSKIIVEEREKFKQKMEEETKNHVTVLKQQREEFEKFHVDTQLRDEKKTQLLQKQLESMTQQQDKWRREFKQMEEKQRELWMKEQKDVQAVGERLQEIKQMHITAREKKMKKGILKKLKRPFKKNDKK